MSLSAAGVAYALGLCARSALLGRLQLAGAAASGSQGLLAVCRHEAPSVSGQSSSFMQARLFSALPPHTILGMPALSPTMSQGNIAKWNVKVGDEVKPGTVLAEVETDKATMGFENQDDGYVAKLLVADGTKDIPIGKPLCVLVEDPASIPAFANFTGGAPAAAPAAAAPKAAAAAAAPKPAPAAAPSKAYPPHLKLAMPSLSPTMEKGNIVAWKVKAGDAIKPGDILAEVETDKATLGFENQDEGYIAKILFGDGARDITVGTPVAIIVDDAETIKAFADYSDAAAGPSSSAAAAGPTAEAPSTSGSSNVVVSSRLGPAARMLLETAGLSASDVTPSGPNNIVTKGDVLAAIAAGVKPRGAAAAAPKAPAAPAAAAAAPKPAAAPAPAAASKPLPAPPAGTAYMDTPNSQIRRIIAARLLESKLTVPALYASADADLDAVSEFRAMLASQGTKVSINDIVMKAVAAALKEVPQANVYWDVKEGAVKPFSSIDISVAVATEKGLITPIVKGADGKSLKDISREVKELAKKAKDNKLKPEEFQGGSFTVSNLGMFGLSHFSAIINPPQAAILAVGGTQQRVVLRNGKPVSQSYMTVTLSADNRVYDGDLVGAVLSSFCKHLANPVNLLL